MKDERKPSTWPHDKCGICFGDFTVGEQIIVNQSRAINYHLKCGTDWGVSMFFKTTRELYEAGAEGRNAE